MLWTFWELKAIFAIQYKRRIEDESRLGKGKKHQLKYDWLDRRVVPARDIWRSVHEPKQLRYSIGQAHRQYHQLDRSKQPKSRAFRCEAMPAATWLLIKAQVVTAVEESEETTSERYFSKKRPQRRPRHKCIPATDRKYWWPTAGQILLGEWKLETSDKRETPSSAPEPYTHAIEQRQHPYQY